MKLLTDEIQATLPALYSQEQNPDPQVVAKFFCPWGRWTWYVTEGSPVNAVGEMIPADDTEQEAVDFLFFGWVAGDIPELGYVSLSELEAVRGPFGLRIERDLHFAPKPLSEVQKLHRAYTE